MQRLLWTPRAHALGDVTLVRVGEEYHLFSEMTPMGHGGSGSRVVGHAVSRDLFAWEELPPAIPCGPPGSWDAYSIFHMDAYVHEGMWYMPYTGLDKGGPGQQQAIGMATSRDGIQWTKHPGNPVLRADPKYYEPAIPREATYQEKDFGRLWFRDPCVIQNSATREFGMIVVARDLRQDLDVRGCLAWATSRDLLRWEAQPPIYSPGRFHTIETPSIFEHKGRHYIIFMTHPEWGTPLLTTDPYQNAGDFYAISEHGWTGPWHSPADEILVAAKDHTRMGAQRTIEGQDGNRFHYGWLRMYATKDDLQPKLTHSMTVPPARRVRFMDDGEMHVVYNPRIERFAQTTGIQPKSAPKIEPLEPARWRLDEGRPCGKNFAGRSVAWLPEEQADSLFSVRVKFLRGERAGIVLRANAKATSGWQIVADCRLRRIEFGLLDGADFIDARAWTPRDELELKVIAMGESLEVYADDRLMIHQVRYREQRGRLGFLVERAEARFSEARLLV